VDKREQKTADELVAMITKRIGIGSGFVNVHECPQLGWNASIVTAPRKVAEYQSLVETVAAELRQKYALKKTA